MLIGAWRSQMEALPACEEIMSPSIAVWPQCTSVTDIQTDDRQTGLWQYRLIGLPAMSRQKQTREWGPPSPLPPLDPPLDGPSLDMQGKY